MKKLRVREAQWLSRVTLWRRPWLAEPLFEPPSPYLSAGFAGSQILSSCTSRKWKGPSAYPCLSPSQTDVFLKGALCCKTRARRTNLVPPWPVEASTWPMLPLCQSQGKGRRKFSTASSRVVLPRAHYQARATECGVPVAHPVSNGTETSTLLPLFSSGSSGALRGLLILACNGKCVAMLNLEPLFTARRIEGSRSLCLIYKQCMGERAEERRCKNPCGIRKCALMHVTRWF